MQVGIVSDTHGQSAFAQAAAYVLESFSVEQVLHCGDIGSTGIVEIFSKWPTHYVFGNTDDAREVLREAIEASGGFCYGTMADFELDGRRIGITHGDDAALLTRMIRSHEYALVCSGHTHQKLARQDGPTLVLNPGALFRATQHTVAIVDLQTMQHEIVGV
ncbi:metallophosphoesterase family protein [Blastopirellula marina]|uniref:Phosphoesterase n=1 Tax=Blastopirellula marina TaxID=124 RepID=A0A2S8FNZ9_9BACT|nr:metallophosphoesterase family protein [Blastopirellula marina]PQO33903.1 YfcE family phosphodiesterase [Blastopirellula marina]PTL43690.1 metallophosphoesterase [Blastopirellula marina]